MTQKLRILLYVMMAYLTIFGILFIFLPSVAEKVLSTSLPDRPLSMLYGQLTLTFAFIAYLASQGGNGLSKLTNALMVMTAGHVIIFAFLLATGGLAFAAAGPPLIINLVFTALLFVFRPSAGA
ncbi:MAG: hypothetical protein LC131_02155 [Anaerolineae bacterium]|nr:hypothetical protein [Anaerolineae bacterium]HNS40832.1 hypothetical protein [Promineifilum sp.]